MRILAALALILAVAARAEDVTPVPADLATQSLDQLWTSACLWEVGSNKDLVPAARAELVRRGTPVVDYLVPAKLDTKDTLITRALTVVVTGIGKDAVPKLLPQLEAENANVRRNAADLLGALQAKEAAPAIAKLLADPDARLGALAALGALKEPSAVPEIVTLMRSDAPERVRYTAASTLGQIGGEDAIAALVSQLAAKDAPNRFAAEAALVQLKAVAHLQAALQSKDQRVVLHALAALGRISDPAPRAAIAKLSQHDDPIVRGYAVEALGTMLDEKTRASLQSLAHNESNTFVRGKLAVVLAPPLP